MLSGPAILRGGRRFASEAAQRGWGRGRRRVVPAGGALPRRELAADRVGGAVDGGGLVRGSQAAHHALAPGVGSGGRDGAGVLSVLQDPAGDRKEELTQAAASAPPRPALLPYALASAALCGLGLAGASQTGEPRAALFGAATASALCALPALALGAPHGTSGILAGFVAGFFARMVAVAAGLILSGARGGAAFAYASSFFALYALTQAVEVAYVWGSSRRRRAGA